MTIGSIGLGLGYLMFSGMEYANWKTLFKNCGLYKDEMYPKLQEKKRTLYGYCLRFTLPLGLGCDDFLRKQQAIEQYLNRKIDIKYSNKNILIEVYETELEICEFKATETRGPVDLVIGYTHGGKLLKIDLADGAPHVLIAGETGSGKSTVLRSIITNLILTKKRRDIKLHLIDLKKGAEFGIFRKCGMVENFARDRGEAEKLLHKLSCEVDRRYDLFFKNDVVDIKEYNQRFKNKKLDYQIVFVDEFADLRREKESQNILLELASKARACGIHLVVSTQRPSAKIIDGDIRANIPIIVGLKTATEINSRIIIEENGLEKLRGKGHGFLKAGKLKEFQSMNLTPERARDLLKSFYVEQNQEHIEKDDISGEVKDFSFLEVIK
nr:FtsK/SpoIIIE domain-containing protein [Anaerosolibacter carboniphilus]